MKTRFYRIIWIRDSKKTQGILFPGPLTHEEACICLSKVTPWKERRDMLEEITQKN